MKTLYSHLFGTLNPVIMWTSKLFSACDILNVWQISDSIILQKAGTRTVHVYCHIRPNKNSCFLLRKNIDITKRKPLVNLLTKSKPVTFLSRLTRINCIDKKNPRLFTTCFYVFHVKNLQDVKIEVINKYTAFCRGIFASKMVPMQLILRFLLWYTGSPAQCQRQKRNNIQPCRLRRLKQCRSEFHR